MAFNPPYYMTGPASRPGAMKAWARRQKAIKLAKGIKSSGNPMHRGDTRPPVTPSKKGSKVVATLPGSNTAKSTATTHNPGVTRPPTTGTITDKKVPTNPKKGGTKRPTVPKNPPVSGPKANPNAGVGFNPQKMADTITDLGYDADLLAIQNQIDMNRGNMAEALKDITAWANQIEEQRAYGAGQAQKAWQGAIQQNQVSDANIANLFGGQAAGENAAYAGAGADMLGALSASDQSFDARMAPILAAQGMDYQRRARSGFNQDLKELQSKQLATQAEKKQAYQKNLFDLMNMQWDRKQDILQNQVTQQALQQARQLAGIELKKGQQDIVQGNQAIQANAQEIKAKKLALKKNQIELQKILQNPNGVNWNDPATRSQIGNAAFAGALSTKNTFMVNPKIALRNALISLEQMGLANDPRAIAAVNAAMRQILNFSHGHHQWTAFSINKNGQIVYDPTKRRKKK